MESCPRLKHTRGDGREGQNWHLVRRSRILTPEQDSGTLLKAKRGKQRGKIPLARTELHYVNRVLSTLATNAWRHEGGGKLAHAKKVKDPETVNVTLTHRSTRRDATELRGRNAMVEK